MPPEAREMKSFAFSSKAAGDGSTFEGMASVYHVLDGYNEIVAPGAFARSLPRFLEKGVIRYMHGVPVGVPTKAVEQGDGLAIAGKISDTATGRDARVLLADGVIKSLSIGFSTVGAMYLNEEALKQYWGKAGYVPSPDEVRRAKYGARVLTDVDLYEVSLVDIPANDACDITAVKAALSGRFTAADLLSSARLQLDGAKAGRVLSKANIERLRTHESALRTCADDLKSMIDAHSPKSDDGGGPDPEPESSGEIDVKALRAQLDLLSL